MPGSAGRYKIVFTIFSLLMIACSIFLRIWHLGNIPGMNGDEAFYGVQSLGIIRGHPIQWLTPTGNVINVLFYGPCVLLHKLFPPSFPPSFALIRSIAVVSGLLALVANYLLCRRVFDARTALVSTVALAVLPEDIAQGRFGWDPSQSLLADAFVVYLSMLIAVDPRRSRWWTAWAAVATLAALSIHPTNVFVVPFVLLAIFLRRRSQIMRLYAVKPLTAASLATYAVTFVVVGLCIVVAVKRADFDLSVPIGYARLFSGVTVYQFVAGSFMPADTPAYRLWLWTAAPLLIFVMTLVHGIRNLRGRHGGSDADHLLFLGWMISTLMFFIIAGASGLSPGNERYALCLILPGTLCVCRLALALADRYQRLRYPLGALAACVCVLLLANFYVNYFQYIERTGGTGHPTFRTGVIEPKLAAYRLIESQAGPGVPILIVTSEWWNYQPLSYLAAADRRALVIAPAQIYRPEVGSYLARATAARELWEVEFDGSPACNDFKAHLASHNIPWTERQITDFGGRPVIDVIHWSLSGTQ
jgi:hypothetical protein